MHTIDASVFVADAHDHASARALLDHVRAQAAPLIRSAILLEL